MRVHVLQHVPFEGLGSIEAWLRERNAKVTTTRLFETDTLPPLDDIDLIIALGGPMSINDEALLPWLVNEKQFITDAIQAGKAVLGICLGAQLIANALGSRVYPNPEKEIGWFPIHGVKQTTDTFSFPDSIQVFHWHGETFDLSQGAVHLATSEACTHQAFQYGRRAIGLQFHLETTPQSADAIITNCGDELIAGRYIQTESELRSVSPVAYQEINSVMVQVLDYLVD